MEFVWVAPLKLWVGKYEVTNGEYRVKEPGHDSGDFSGRSLNGDRQPVVFVTFADAQAYAEWLTERERQAGRLPDGLRYRLPTNPEWLTYAQCGDGRTYPWGNEWPPRYGNFTGEEMITPQGLGLGILVGYRDGHPVSCPVEDSGVNEWGLYGVGGNAWEVCASGVDAKPSFAAWRGAAWSYSNQGNMRCDYLYVSRGGSRGRCGCGFRLLLGR